MLRMYLDRGRDPSVTRTLALVNDDLAYHKLGIAHQYACLKAEAE